MIFHRQRGEERTSIAVKAWMCVGDYRCEAMLLNASSHGVLAALKSPPVRGTRIRLEIGDMVLTGQVRWRGVDCCGIALRDSIAVEDLAGGHAPALVRIPQPRALRGLGGRLRAIVPLRAG